MLGNLERYILQENDKRLGGRATMATTITVRKLGEVEVNNNGRVVTVPIIEFAHDQDLRELIGQALENPGAAIVVPNTGARLPRPRNAVQHAISQ